MSAFEGKADTAHAPLNVRFRGFEPSPFFNRSGCTVSARGNGRHPMYTIATAAAAVGRNKSAILRAINAGKISITKDENGEWQIDPAELHCIYPPLRSASVHGNEQLRLHQSPLLTSV
jgi:hypothetical protein